MRPLATAAHDVRLRLLTRHCVRAAFSPDYTSDHVMLSTNSFSVLISRDRGATWSALTTVRHTVDGGDNPHLPHCKLARNSARLPYHAIPDPADKPFGDMNSYCLVCNEGHAREASTGTCAGGRAGPSLHRPHPPPLLKGISEAEGGGGRLRHHRRRKHPT